MSTTPEHLGGHAGLTHTDAGAMRFLKDRFCPVSVLDVGCGTGGMEGICLDLGLLWVGVDGDASCAKTNVVTHDFTRGELPPLKTDLVWSVEFVEHVHPAYLQHTLEALTRGRMALCMSHALPGKYGHHHVNCQPPEYWIDALRLWGFVLDAEGTEGVRAHSSMRREFMRQTGLVFVPIP